MIDNLQELRLLVRKFLSEMPEYMQVNRQDVNCNDDTMNDVHLDSKSP